MTDCGHTCCAISANRYHAHNAEPDACEHCVAPEIPGLPTDPDRLLDHVIELTASVHEASRADPAIQRLSPRWRRTVLAARVGLALAFPDHRL
jgi:hypothetical protein